MHIHGPNSPAENELASNRSVLASPSRSEQRAQICRVTSSSPINRSTNSSPSPSGGQNRPLVFGSTNAVLRPVLQRPNSALADWFANRHEARRPSLASQSSSIAASFDGGTWDLDDAASSTTSDHAYNEWRQRLLTSYETHETFVDREGFRAPSIADSSMSEATTTTAFSSVGGSVMDSRPGTSMSLASAQSSEMSFGNDDLICFRLWYDSYGVGPRRMSELPRSASVWPPNPWNDEVQEGPTRPSHPALRTQRNGPQAMHAENFAAPIVFSEVVIQREQAAQTPPAACAAHVQTEERLPEL